MPEQPSILLIDDEARLRHNLQVLLEEEGYRVVSAEDGAEGIQRLQGALFDLVITDVVMPRVDGFQVMEYLKDYCPDAVVIAITAYVSTESAIEALRRGAYDYLAKPFDVDLMQFVIKRALERARMQRAFRYYMGELERKVEERTRKLADANTQVEKSMAELRAVRQQLLHTERFRALGEVTAAAARELGDSLATIVGFTQVISRISPTENRLKSQLEQIGEMAFRCHEIVKNLNYFSTRPALEKIPTNLNALCERMLDELADQTDLTNVDITRRFDQDLPHTMVDPQQFLQACLTLALHACQTAISLYQGAHLVVETARAQRMIQLTFRVETRDRNRASLLGMPTPFWATKEGVSELGLSLAYGAIKEHDGRISVKTTPGEEVTYLVELPVQTLPASAVEPAMEVRDFMGCKHVLVVAADEKTLVLLQEIMRHLGHDSTGTPSAEQAMQHISANDYDLIIADTAFPMDSSDFYNQLQTLRPELAQRLLFITDGAISDEVSLFLQYVDCCLVKKPFRVADIEMGLRQVLQA